MPAGLIWEDETHTILCCTFEGEFGPENYGVMEGQLPMMIREVKHPVGVIFYLRRGASFPNPKAILPEMRILLNVMPPNLMGIVGVGSGFLLTNPITVRLADLVVRWRFNGKIRVARSKNQAYKLLRGIGR